MRFARAVRAARGHGGRGRLARAPHPRQHSHTVMMDRNGDEPAMLVQDWLNARWLWG